MRCPTRSRRRGTIRRASRSARCSAVRPARDGGGVFREDLRRNPGNGWSLFGLAQAQRAQNERDAAEAEAQLPRRLAERRRAAHVVALLTDADLPGDRQFPTFERGERLVRWRRCTLYCNRPSPPLATRPAFLTLPLRRGARQEILDHPGAWTVGLAIIDSSAPPSWPDATLHRLRPAWARTTDSGARCAGAAGCRDRRCPRSGTARTARSRGSARRSWG